ncbi:MAG TPA: hypothetical protein VIH21_08590 [Dehalococcoidia bacterium]
MAEVFAGFVIGYALSLAISPLAAWIVISSNDRSGVAQRLAPPGTNFVALSMVLHFTAMLMLTAIGIVLGMALGGIEDRRPAGGIGSPNVIYTAIVVALTAVIFLPTVVLPAARRYVLPFALVFAVMFGWAMPWLATLG